MRNLRLYLLTWMLTCSGVALAADAAFVPRELFRLPFGRAREQLGSRVATDRLVFPSDFTIDATGRFYINDVAKHRVARFSALGEYQLSYSYPETARQVFAHADEKGNLWLLISDPSRGIYYGVHDPQGKSLRTAIFSQFTRFRLHIGDDAYARVILWSDSDPTPHLYRFDPATLAMKRDPAGLPSETHHRLQTSGRTYFIDQDPHASGSQTERVQTVTDEARRPVGKIEGQVIYVTDGGEVYTRFGKREIRIYDVKGRLKGKVILTGLSSSSASIRFDARGNLYQLDGLPDRTDEALRAGASRDDPRTDIEDLHYTIAMPGMRLIRWERQAPN